MAVTGLAVHVERAAGVVERGTGLVRVEQDLGEHGERLSAQREVARLLGEGERVPGVVAVPGGRGQADEDLDLGVAVAGLAAQVQRLLVAVDGVLPAAGPVVQGRERGQRLGLGPRVAGLLGQGDARAGVVEGLGAPAEVASRCSASARTSSSDASSGAPLARCAWPRLLRLIASP